MTYFVTGGTGFIGRFLIDGLLEREGTLHAPVRGASVKKLDALRQTRCREGAQRFRKLRGKARFVSCDRFHDFERTMQLTYFASLRLIMGFMPAMVAQGGGHIINTSSIGVPPRAPRFSAYVASKAVLDAFGDCAASEFVDNNVAAKGRKAEAAQLELTQEQVAFAQFTRGIHG